MYYNVGVVFQFANCQSPMLAIKNSIAEKMKERVEKTSAFAYSMANLNSSISF